MVCYSKVIFMSRVEELITYFKNIGYKTETIEHNKLEITKDGYKGFYLKVLVEDEITVLNFIISTKEFGVNFDNYTSEANIYAKFSEGNELSIRYTHPFIFLHLDTQEFTIMPVTSLVTSLLIQMPVSVELLEKVKEITKQLDTELKEEAK